MVRPSAAEAAAWKHAQHKTVRTRDVFHERPRAQRSGYTEASNVQCSERNGAAQKWSDVRATERIKFAIQFFRTPPPWLQRQRRLIYISQSFLCTIGLCSLCDVRGVGQVLLYYYTI